MIVLAIVVMLFGAKRIPEAMQGIGKGFRSFKKGLSGEDEAPKIEPPKSDGGEKPH